MIHSFNTLSIECHSFINHSSRRLISPSISPLPTHHRILSESWVRQSAYHKRMITPHVTPWDRSRQKNCWETERGSMCVYVCERKDLALGRCVAYMDIYTYIHTYMRKMAPSWENVFVILLGCNSSSTCRTAQVNAAFSAVGKVMATSLEKEGNDDQWCEWWCMVMMVYEESL